MCVIVSHVDPRQSAFARHSTHVNVLMSQTVPFLRPAQLALVKHSTQTMPAVWQ
jgi:hypothetical protein